MTRRLYSARPLRTRARRYFSEPGPRVTALRSTVRAPDITASASVRSSIMCALSRWEPKFGMARLALAILPSALMARFRKTKGNLACGLIDCFRFKRKHLLPSVQEHSVPVAEKAITFADGFAIGVQDEFTAACFSGGGESAYEHE